MIVILYKVCNVLRGQGELIQFVVIRGNIRSEHSLFCYENAFALYAMDMIKNVTYKLCIRACAETNDLLLCGLCLMVLRSRK